VTELEGKEEVGRTYPIQTLAGTITPTIKGEGMIRVDMGEPELTPAKIPTTLNQGGEKVVSESLNVAGKSYDVSCVSMGNPHCLVFVEKVADIELEKIGPLFETHEVFPQKTNTEFIEVVRPDYLKMRVWERGAGITLACGTGACATVVAGVLNGKCDRTCTVELPGGCLEIEWNQEDNHVYMTGPALKVFSGKYVT